MLVVHIITSLDEGGAEASLYRLCYHSSSVQHRVICLMHEGKYGPLLRQAGVPVDCLDLRRGQLSLQALLQLWRWLRCLQPDLVQTWMYHSDLIGGLVARMAGVRRVVWGVRTSQLNEAISSRSTLAVIRICGLFSWLVPDRIVCCAKRAAQVHEAMGYAASKLEVIPNGVDLHLFQPNPEAGLRLRIQLGLPEKEPILGMVARFDPQKDHGNLLQALSQLRGMGLRLSCLLVGSGLDSSNQELLARLQELELSQQIVLLGSRCDVPVVMNAISLHVLSSAVEAFPNVLAESMACGVPCIATDVGDTSLILGSTGWLVPPRKPQALASAVVAALRESELDRLRRCQLARQHVAQLFSISRMVERYEQLYCDLI